MVGNNSGSDLRSTHFRCTIALQQQANEAPTISAGADVVYGAVEKLADFSSHAITARRSLRQ